MRLGINLSRPSSDGMMARAHSPSGDRSRLPLRVTDLVVSLPLSRMPCPLRSWSPRPCNSTEKPYSTQRSPTACSRRPPPTKGSPSLGCHYMLRGTLHQHVHESSSGPRIPLGTARHPSPSLESALAGLVCEGRAPPPLENVSDSPLCGVSWRPRCSTALLGAHEITAQAPKASPDLRIHAYQGRRYGDCGMVRS